MLFSSIIDYSELGKASKYVLDTVPEIKTIIEAVLDFRNLLKSSSVLALDQWLKNVRKLNNKHLNSFINGVERDKEAIQNSIIYPELSNGFSGRKGE